MNILLCFRYSHYTSAVYYEKAFKGLGHDVLCCEPAGVPDVDWHPDLFVWIEAGQGVRPKWIPSSVPTVAYYIDSHTQRIWHREDAKRYDKVYVAQKEFVCEYGLTAEWLPMACDQDLHTPTVTSEPLYDVAFVGHLYEGSLLYDDRRLVLGMLAKRYKCNFVQGVYFRDMANVYASARVAFNISVLADLNMRVFEAMCSCRPLVTDLVPGIEDLFRDGGHLMLYGGMDGMLNAIDELLANESYADAIGRRGRAAVLTGHTYVHRAKQMLAGVSA